MGYKDQYTLGQVVSLVDKHFVVLMHQRRRNHQEKPGPKWCCLCFGLRKKEPKVTSTQIHVVENIREGVIVAGQQKQHFMFGFYLVENIYIYIYMYID